MFTLGSCIGLQFSGNISIQAIKVMDGGQRLAPPPGCPRAIYQLMINCWLATHPHTISPTFSTPSSPISMLSVFSACRNPTSSERLTTDVLTQCLARSDTALLKWDPSDKPAGDPLALQLGAPLDSASQLYPDLQRTYLPVNSTDVDYEDPDD